MAEVGSAERRSLLILSMSGFASTLAMRFFDPMIGVIARDLSADPARIALLASAFALPYALVQPVLGPIGDALGKERVMTACLGLLAAALLACALAPNADVLFGARIVSGGGGGGIIPLALATVGDRVEMANRQVAISRFLVFSISGQLIGGTVAGLLADLFGWREVVGLAAAVAFASFLAFTFGVERPARPPGGFTFGVAGERYRRIVRLPRAQVLFAAVFVEGIVVFGLMPYIAPLLEARGGGGAFQAGLILASFAAGGVTYTFIVRWLLRVFGVRRMLMIAGVAVALALAAFGQSPPWQWQAALFFVTGCAFYMLHNSYQTQVTELASDARASAVSLHAFSFFCGQAVGPVTVGLLLAQAGLGATATLCGIGALLLGLLTALALFPRQPRPL